MLPGLAYRLRQARRRRRREVGHGGQVFGGKGGLIRGGRFGGHWETIRGAAPRLGIGVIIWLWDRFVKAQAAMQAGPASAARQTY
jgi:hypothetical protein